MIDLSNETIERIFLERIMELSIGGGRDGRRIL